MGRHKKETLISPARTPVDTIDSALNDLDRQNASLEQMLKVNRQLRSGMEQARTKAVAALESRHIRLLPASAEPDTGTRNVGFLGAGLAARAAEVISAHGAPMHITDIAAQVSLMPGLQSVNKDSLRATMNSDCKRARPRLTLLGSGMYGLAGVHDVVRGRKRLKAA